MIMTASVSLLSALGLLALCGFTFYLWRDYRLDVFRERVFSLRDGLFLYALENKINFESIAYVGLRDRMNTMLRFAHELNFTRFFLVATLHPFSEGNPELIAWEKAVDSLPQEKDRARLRDIRDAFALAIFEHILLRSFFRFILLRPTKAIVQIRRMTRHTILPRATRGIEQLESEALEEEANYPRKDDPVTVGAH